MRAVCGVQFKDRNRFQDTMLILSVNETLHQLAIADSPSNSLL